MASSPTRLIEYFHRPQDNISLRSARVQARGSRARQDTFRGYCRLAPQTSRLMVGIHGHGGWSKSNTEFAVSACSTAVSQSPDVGQKSVRPSPDAKNDQSQGEVSENLVVGRHLLIRFAGHSSKSGWSSRSVLVTMKVLLFVKPRP